MLNEGVSKLAHPLFLRVNAQTHFLGQYLNIIYNDVLNKKNFYFCTLNSHQAN